MEEPLQCPSILVVEDDEGERALIVDALEIYYNDITGEHINAVHSGSQCLALNLDRYDIVLTDYFLPDMCGLDLMKRIQGHWDVPVVIVTGENDTATAVESIRLGAEDYIVKLGDYLFAIPVVVDKAISQHRVRKENRRLQKRLEEMLVELQEKNRQLEESLHREKEMASTDPLTGLANRRRFRLVLDRMYAEAMRYGYDLTCCMCDLDQYKKLNDTLGHQVGDDMLRAAADLINASLRSSDVAARYGGDEFVLLLPHTSVERAESVCERIRRQVALHTQKYHKDDVFVTMSVGIASLNSDHPTDADKLVALADRALYIAKEHGKDRICALSRLNTPGQASA